MKHHDDTPLIEPSRIRQQLLLVGVGVADDQADALALHARLVLEANRLLNLTRIVAAEDVVQLHIVDSLAFLPLVGPLSAPIVDIGSGAGYPGIPLALATGLPVTLCESVRKKAAFLEEVVGTLGIDATVYHGRAEQMAVDRPGAAGTIVARAVAALGALVELAAPLLPVGGRLVALKGTPQPAEIAAADRTAELAGMSRSASLTYALPAGDHRSVFVYTRVGSHSISLPRRPGMAQRSPLVP